MSAPWEENLPPHSVESEQGALGCVLSGAATALDDITEILGTDDAAFYEVRHRKIFLRMLALAEAGKPTDLLTVSQELADMGELQMVGGAGYLSSMIDMAPSPANAGYYAATVRDKHLLRKTIQLCVRTANQARADGVRAETLVDVFENEAFRIRDHTTARVLTVKEVGMQSLERLERRVETRGQLGGLASGLVDLDRMTDGFRGGELIVIAARPSGGKTAVGLNILDNICVELKKPGAIFSLEMSSKSLYDRMLCSRARVDASAFRRGELYERDYPKILAASTAINKAPMTFIEADAMTISDVRRTCRRLKRQGLLDFVVVDYLQLVRPTRTQEKKTYEIGEVSTGLKHLAKELDMPIIALAQLNRKVDDMGKTRRPKISDIRDCGQIEQDADVVCLLHTEERQANPAEFFNVTMIVGKQRDGETGDVNLLFHRKYTRFDSATRYSPPEENERGSW